MNNLNKMTFPLRLKYIIEPQATKELSYAQQISKQGIICLKQRCYKTCSCGNKVYEDSLSSSQIHFCSTCGKKIRNENFKYFDYIIDNINYKKIIKLIEERLTGLKFNYLKNERLFKIEGNKIIYIIIPEISSSNFILSQNSGDNCLFIILDPEMTNPSLLQRWLPKSWFIGEILNQDKNFLKENIKALEKEIKIDFKIEDEFNKLLKKSPTFFEKEFVPYFLNELKNKEKELALYLTNLKLNSHTLLNSKVIPIGGAGNPDFIMINLCGYLSDGLKPHKYGEAKRYNKTKFTIQDYGVAMAHSKDGENLFIVSTNNIQNEVWTNIIDLMRINGYYKNVLLDKDLILFLASILKIDFKGV